jgi:hypothetical protein
MGGCVGQEKAIRPALNPTRLTAQVAGKRSLFRSSRRKARDYSAWSVLRNEGLVQTEDALSVPERCSPSASKCDDLIEKPLPAAGRRRAIPLQLL